MLINIVEVRKAGDRCGLGRGIRLRSSWSDRVAFRRAMKRGRSVRHAAWRRGHSDQLRRPSRRRGKSPASNGTARGAFPLHTLRADIDYGTATAHTAYGTCGIKVWIFKGEILEHDPMAQDKKDERNRIIRAVAARDRRRDRDAA